MSAIPVVRFVPCALLLLLSIASASPLPGDPVSDTFAVDVDGKPMPAIHYEDIAYVHFPLDASAEIRITRLDGKAIGDHRIRPERMGYTGKAEGSTLTFTLDRPRHLVVNVDLLPKLFILADPPVDDRPDVKAAGVVDIRDYDIDATGERSNTAMLQKAIDELPAGGTLYFPPGRYLTGSLKLKSHMTLYVDRGAIIKGNSIPDEHRFAGGYYLHFLYGADLVNVSIRGQGTIDANGGEIRNAWQQKLEKRKVPGRVLRVENIDNLEIRGVTFRDSYSWNVHLISCDNVIIDNVKVLSSMSHSNGDGLDLDGCVNVLVKDCFLYCYDDAISPKATSASGRTPQNFTVRNCVLWSQMATGIRLGSETHAPAFRNMVFENIDFLRANTMIRVFNFDGADIHDIVFRNLWIEEYTLFVKDAGFAEMHSDRDTNPGQTYLFQTYMKRRKPDSPVGRIRDILVENVRSQRHVKSRLDGLPGPDGGATVYEVIFKNLREGDEPICDLEKAKIRVKEHAETPTVLCDEQP